MSWLQLIVICGISFLGMTIVAALLSVAHAPDQQACIEAGYTWSHIDYVCVVKLKK